MDIKQETTFTITLDLGEAKELRNDLSARADEYNLLPTTSGLLIALTVGTSAGDKGIEG